MKNQFVAALALTGLLAVSSVTTAAAQQMVNPVTLTPQGKFDLGVTISQVYEQKFKDYDLNITGSVGDSGSYKYSGKIKDDQYYLLTLTYGLTDWANLFAQAGMVNGGKYLCTSFTSGEEWEAKLKDQFVWAVGAKAQAFKLANGLALNLGARYLRYDDRKLEPWRENHSGYDHRTDWNDDHTLDYWQVDLTGVVSLPLGPVTPYAGVGYSYFEAKERGRTTSIYGDAYYMDYDSTTKSQDQLLALCGLDVALGEHLGLYLQAEFVARTTLGLGLSWSF